MRRLSIPLLAVAMAACSSGGEQDTPHTIATLPDRVTTEAPPITTTTAASEGAPESESISISETITITVTDPEN